MLPEGERIRAVEVELGELRRTIAELAGEILRSRGRLHQLEATTEALVYAQTARLREDRRRQGRLERRIQLLSLLVALAGVVTPLIYGGAFR